MHHGFHKNTEQQNCFQHWCYVMCYVSLVYCVEKRIVYFVYCIVNIVMYCIVLYCIVQSITKSSVFSV